MATRAQLSYFIVAILTSHRTASSLQLPEGCTVHTTIAADFLPTLTYNDGPILPVQDTVNGGWTYDLSVAVENGFHIQCAGKGNLFKNYDSTVINGWCDSEGNIKTDYGVVAFEKLVCSGRAVSSATRNGTCAGGSFTKIDVNIGTQRFYEVCHDESTSATYYTKSNIDGPRLDESVSISRPSFAEATFYPEIDANKCYTQAEQTITVAEIVGPNSYIQPTKNLFFARGHMTPNGDGITADEKFATFYFINASPQWQTINGGNWERLESSLRNYAEAKQSVLTVWTGAFKIGTLKDSNGNDHEIYLGKTSTGTLLQRLPVPRLLWKAVVDPRSNTGIVVVVIHNPYEENHEDSDYLCEDVCDQITWVGWDTENVKTGVTYCCSIDSFQPYVPDVPLPKGLALMT